MVDLMELKKLCEDHNECLWRTKILKGEKLLKVVDEIGREFILNDGERKALNNYNEKIGAEIEIKIQKLFNQIK